MTEKKQNVTVSLPSSTIKKAKLLAVRHDTSISGLLAREIDRLVSEDDAYEEAKRSAVTRLRRGFHMGGKITASRDELHERKDLR